MADYPSIESKAQDAVAAAFAEFTGGPSYTVYKGNDVGEITLPAVVIQCERFEKIHDDAEAGARNNFECTVNVLVLSTIETTAAAHANIYGWIQAIGIQSADQMPGLMTAAAIANFTASAWGIESGGETTFEDQRRVSMLTFSLICSTA